jgi:uncharacterized repeat protein (TIGR02543 family)
MINKFVPYVLDDQTGEPTTTQGAYYKSMVSSINHAKKNLEANGYEIGEILLVWCQGESEGVYLGNENQYAITYEESITSNVEKTKWYKKQFHSIVEQLKADVGLSTAFIIRIGHRLSDNATNLPIIIAQNELGREVDNIVLVSTIFAGAKSFIKEDGSVRNLMRDNSHYYPEGYLRAGLEAGVNAGIYINSNKQVKPILLEYHTLVNDDNTLYEREVEKFLYNPCRVDINYLKNLGTEGMENAIFYKVSYSTEHGTAPDTVEKVKILNNTLFPTLTADGYVFKGWYLDENFTQKAKAGTILYADTVLYAKWERLSGSNEDLGSSEGEW